MRKIIIFFACAVIFTSPVFADTGVFVYTEGEVDLKDKRGEIFWADIGDEIEPGETVITGYASLAEIEKENLSLLTVSENTVFTYLQNESGGEKQDVLSCALGSMTFKFNKVLGREPAVATPSMVAGIRGTEFTVYSGADGSSLILVDSGRVEVSSEGETVALEKEEGVEVAPGEAPGEKITVKHGSIDYSTWNNSKLEEFYSDPAGGVEGLEKRLISYIAEIKKLLPDYEKNKQKIEKEREKLDQLEEKEGKDARSSYYKKEVYPLEVQTSYMALNLRYYTLSALSLRRHVAGRLYMYMKAKYIRDPDNPQYTLFLDRHEDFLDIYEKSIVPRLVEADI